MKEKNSAGTKPKKAIRCPECGSASARAHFPFCSERCRQVDLNRWLSEGYVIAGERIEDPEKPE